MMNDSYHIYFKGEILFKNLSKDEFEFVWGKLYTSYINALNKELTYELIISSSRTFSYSKLSIGSVLSFLFIIGIYRVQIC